jgi:hypothetical protein
MSAPGVTQERGIAVEQQPTAILAAGQDRIWNRFAGYYPNTTGFGPVSMSESAKIELQGLPERPNIEMVSLGEPKAISDTATNSFEHQQTQPPVIESVSAKRSYYLGSIAVEAAGVTHANSLEGEGDTRRRYTEFLGSSGLGRALDAKPNLSTREHRSSLDLLRAAAEGDEDSHQALLVDARTHVYEVYGGVGESMSVEMDVDENGQIVWGGQTTEDRQYHVLTAYRNQIPELLRAVHAEGLSGFRSEDRYRDGQLEGKVLFDFSAMSDEVDRSDLADWGYFLNSIACSLRSTRFLENKCRVNSIFVAGVDQRQVLPRQGETEAEEVARQERGLQMRFDVRVVRKMYVLFGVEGAAQMNATDLLATPLIAPEEFDILDMVMLYDALAAEEMVDGAKTFFGSAELWQEAGSPDQLTRGHYERHIQQREERHAKYESLCEDIVQEQVRRQHEASTPRQAADLKRRVVLDMTVKRAVHDASIDATRFGRKSAEHIEMARRLYDQGDTAGGDRFVSKAQKSAIDPSCPPGARHKQAESDGSIKDDHEEDCVEVKDGDTVKCPNCKHIVKAIVPEKGGKIYCANGECDAAPDYLKSHSHVKQAPSSATNLFSGKKKSAKAPRSRFELVA